MWKARRRFISTTHSIVGMTCRSARCPALLPGPPISDLEKPTAAVARTCIRVRVIAQAWERAGDAKATLCEDSMRTREVPCVASAPACHALTPGAPAHCEAVIPSLAAPGTHALVLLPAGGWAQGTPEAPRCGFSARVVDALRGAGVRFGAFDILADDAVRQGLKKLSDWPTYPQARAWLARSCAQLDRALRPGCSLS